MPGMDARLYLIKIARQRRGAGAPRRHNKHQLTATEHTRALGSQTRRAGIDRQQGRSIAYKIARPFRNANGRL